MMRPKLRAGRFWRKSHSGEAIFHQQGTGQTAAAVRPAGVHASVIELSWAKSRNLADRADADRRGRAADQPAALPMSIRSRTASPPTSARFCCRAAAVPALAEHGDASAQCNLGVMYEQGERRQNYREAMKWFRLAAVQGNASAQSNLGVMYYKGQGIAQDYGEAMRWYRLAAAQRNPEAQFNLGVMYEEGRGIAQDRVRAHMWFNLAAAIATDENAKLAAKTGTSSQKT